MNRKQHSWHRNAQRLTVILTTSSERYSKVERIHYSIYAQSSSLKLQVQVKMLAGAFNTF